MVTFPREEFIKCFDWAYTQPRDSGCRLLRTSEGEYFKTINGENICVK